jgi:phosphoglycerol transferase MdoB-like AlkP superfamily enzyme
MRVKDITPNLERLTHEGLYFTNFYTNSFRTDRALVSVHSGLPAQTTMSVMDNPRISTSLPSIAGTLSKNGYATTFYYGGDINYSNMRSYFVGTGFQTIVSDKDFPRELHTGKWGVADGAVYDRMIADIKATSDEPFFLSIMTESSHEPFDVPNYKRVDDDVLNAFSYADDCLGRFIAQLKELPCWDKTLVVIVPDHLGAFPSNIDNYQYWRYHAPLIILGGMMKTNATCNVVGTQIDISATLFGLLGISHEEFTYSKDLLDNSAPHFAFFTFPDAMGMITDSSRVIFDNTANQAVSPEGAYTDSLTQKAKAYLQKLYDDIDKR